MEEVHDSFYGMEIGDGMTQTCLLRWTTMASISWGWDDAWAIYPDVEPEMQKSIEDALASMLPNVAPKIQIQALETAPMKVIKKHAHLLHDRAKAALGLEVKRTSRTSKASLKDWSWMA
jgi:hypothetical protein